MQFVWLEDADIDARAVSIKMLGSDPVSRRAANRTGMQFHCRLVIVVTAIAIGVADNCDFAFLILAPDASGLGAKRAIAEVHILWLMRHRYAYRAAVAASCHA